MNISTFQKKIYTYYKKHKRDFLWRKTRNPYHILVSEIMLQQTQVDRVSIKYKEFVKAFPDFKSLAEAWFSNVLKVWQGMGYNRRALFLKRIAETVVKKYRGSLPKTPDELVKLPGIGKHTAASICAFAYNMPVVFVETNIRTVFIHEFFQDQNNVHDDEILSLIEQTLDTKNPCVWYNALMDYGTMLKSKNINPSRKSAHYVKQSKFEGSNRQVRGKILKLLNQKPLTETGIAAHIQSSQTRIIKNLHALRSEGFIREKKSKFYIAT